MSIQAGRTQTSLGGLGVGGARTAQFRNDSQQQSLSQANNANFGFDDGAANEDQNTTGKRRIPDWIARSSLMRIAKPSRDIEHVCFFEPLNYCERGSLINGFCDYHRHYMFNVELAKVGMLLRNNERLVFVKTPRKLIKLPTPLDTLFIRVFPIPELCNNIDEFEQNLNLSLFAYNLMHKENNNLKKVQQIVMEHKAYIMRVMRMYTPSETTTQIEDSKINRYIEVWLKDRSHDLNDTPFNIKLVYLSNDNENEEEGMSTNTGSSGLRWLLLQECSVITQMIALLYETPYVISRSLNDACLAIPPAFTILNEKNLVLDCTKASHGTTLSENIPSYGDPATLSMFRSDNNENTTFVRDGYNPNREICFYSKIDKKALLKDVRVEEITENEM